MQVACGENHTVVLLKTGLVYTVGANDQLQLGRTLPEGTLYSEEFELIEQL